MDKKNKIVLVLSISLALIVLIGASYAYFYSYIRGLESASTLSATTGSLVIDYTEGNETIKVEKIFPREEAWITKTFTVKGTNTTELTMNYSVGLNIELNEFKEGYLTYTLTNNTISNNGTPISTHTGVINKSGVQSFGYGDFTNTGNTPEEHKYTLEIFYPNLDEDQSNSMGAKFAAHIIISSSKALKITTTTTTTTTTTAPAEEHDPEYNFYNYIYRLSSDQCTSGSSNWQQIIPSAQMIFDGNQSSELFDYFNNCSDNLSSTDYQEIAASFEQINSIYNINGDTSCEMGYRININKFLEMMNSIFAKHDISIQAVPNQIYGSVCEEE